MAKDTDWIKRIKKLREEYGWSQKDIAEEFRVTPGAVGLWEAGIRKMSGPITKLIEIYEGKPFKPKKKKFSK